MKKRIFGIFITMMLGAIVLFGCEKNNNSNKDDKKLSVVTTIYAPYDFAREIALDNANISMLLKPGSETHSFEPTPQDIITIQNCDVFIYVGGESDEWVDNVLESIDSDDIKIIKLMDCVEAVEEEVVDGMESEEHEHEDGEDSSKEHKDEEKEWDEHVWTSPQNAISISKELEKTFAEIDTDNAEKYEKNLKSYISKLEEIDTEFKDVVKSAKRKTVVFGDRFPLRYFVEAYGLEYYAAFPGCSDDTEASAETIAFLSDKVKEEKIPVVFKIELSNGNIAKSIAESTGAKVLTFYSCHNITSDDFKEGKTYIDFMKVNIESLKEALK